MANAVNSTMMSLFSEAGGNLGLHPSKESAAKSLVVAAGAEALALDPETWSLPVHVEDVAASETEERQRQERDRDRRKTETGDRQRQERD